ncbi:TetR/AcrR family transcriptional regulator [Chromohalobacter canadensis]|uniref:TetR/AcrR family transcriptional regulator n=1 Tax=Chromohalobacter canadensis TaxID=141389 RepID=A0ABZ0YEH4_9GAMM|nr:TetR/AcrR family transcriptional regulator [Chromohalobacter canadensis]MCK0769993.1 TetR/AcrR family transcriptional regulator [Chromohalobacter canadensis]WQH10501.1 TetR/AcrR family transcriptional regulator [Chromohalobacter canadensis]
MSISTQAQGRSVHTREKLKHTGLALFAQHGYEGTSLAQIAAETGIKKPSIYNHFPNKAALFLAIFEEVESGIVALIDDSLTRSHDLPTRERLERLIRSCATFIRREHQGVFYKRYLLFPPTDVATQVAAISNDNERRINAHLHVLFEDGRQAGELRALPEAQFIAAFYCLMDGLFAENFYYDADTFERRLEGAWAVFWAGVEA